MLEFNRYARIALRHAAAEGVMKHSRPHQVVSALGLQNLFFNTDTVEGARLW